MKTMDKKYLSYTGLIEYDSKNKEYIAEQIANILQSDWNQEDETATDYIKNKPELITEELMFQLLVEGKVIDPVSDATNQIYTDNNGKVLCL